MRWTSPGSFNLAPQVAELMTFLVEGPALSGISIFCLSIFRQETFVTMSNVLYLLKSFIRWQAIQSHYSQQLQSHLSRSVNMQKADGREPGGKQDQDTGD